MNVHYDETVDIHTLGQILDLKYLTNSYKLFWFLAILDEVRSDHSLIDYRKLAIRMIAKAWYPSIKYKLNFGVQDQLQDIIQYVFNKFKIDIDLTEENLVDLLDSLSDAEFDEKVAFLCKCPV